MTDISSMVNAVSPELQTSVYKTISGTVDSSGGLVATGGTGSMTWLNASSTVNFNSVGYNTSSKRFFINLTDSGTSYPNTSNAEPISAFRLKLFNSSGTQVGGYAGGTGMQARFGWLSALTYDSMDAQLITNFDPISSDTYSTGTFTLELWI
jgi:hypothetical protein